jgi:hypothetical protein
MAYTNEQFIQTSNFGMSLQELSESFEDFLTVRYKI